MGHDRMIFVTRRLYQQRLDGIFGTPRGRGERVMQAARDAGLVSVGKHGPGHDRPLLPMERAALLLVAALCAGTNLTLLQAVALVVADGNWRRQVLAAAVTGADVTLWPAVNPSLAVAVTIPNHVIRDPVIGFAGPTMAQELAA
jgi:hypothetical protein